jgi:hypothetical protein
MSTQNHQSLAANNGRRQRSNIVRTIQHAYATLCTHRTRFAACLVACIILTQACGLIYGLGVQKAFADAAPETYKMTNVIYINRTGLNRAGAFVDCITISETAKPLADIPIKDGSYHKDPFEPNVSIDVGKIQSLYDRQNTEGQDLMYFAGYSINITNAKYVMTSQMANGEIIPANTSDFFTAGFDKSAIAFPVIEKAIMFDSPARYAQQYCDTNGYALRNIINSTYEKEYNMNTLNAFASQLVKDDTIVVYNQTTPSLYRDLAKYGGSLPGVKLVWYAWVLIAAIIACAMVAIPVLTTWIDDDTARKALWDTNQQNLQALTLGLNATKQLADHMLTDKNAQRQLVMNFFANGTISWEQLQYLLKQIDGSYNPLINNCTTNIAAMIAGYFNASVNLYGKFAEGVFDATSWTDWIMNLIYLIAALIVAYIVIVIVSKVKGAHTPCQSVIIPYKI